MEGIITRTHMGGIDLFHRAEYDFKEAVVKEVRTKETVDDYETELVLKLVSGEEFHLFIKQGRNRI